MTQRRRWTLSATIYGETTPIRMIAHPTMIVTDPSRRGGNRSQGDPTPRETDCNWTPPPLEQDLQRHLDVLLAKMRDLFLKLAKQNVFAPHELCREVFDTQREAKWFFTHWLTPCETLQNYPFPVAGQHDGPHKDDQ